MNKFLIALLIAAFFVLLIIGIYLFFKNRLTIEVVSAFIGLVAILITIWLSNHQIAHNVKLAKEQQQISRLNDIHNQSCHLKALQMELEQNYNGYLRHVLPKKESMLSGKTTHHFFEYRTSELQPNLSNFTLAYNTLLLNKVGAIYDLCDEANRIFRYVRSSSIEKGKIKDYWTYLYDKHDKLLGEWKKVINEVGEAANNYEPVSLMLDKNASEIGAQVGGAVDRNGQAITISNYGGIGAERIHLAAEFKDHPEQEYVRDLPYLRRQTSVNFGLFTPRYPDEDLTGKVNIQYSTASSKDRHASSFNIKWDASKQRWLQAEGAPTVPAGFVSFAVGSIFEGSDAQREPEEAVSDVAIKLGEDGQSLFVSNEGNVTISKILIQNLFGQLDGWRDYESQKNLLPGESIEIRLPAQSDEKKSSLSGYAYYQAEGCGDVNYKVFSFEWKPSVNRWYNPWEQ